MVLVASLFFVFASAWCSELQAPGRQIPEPMEVLSMWSNWSKRTDHIGGVEVTRFNAGDAQPNMIILTQVDGEFNKKTSMILEGTARREYTLISNPKYWAQIVHLNGVPSVDVIVPSQLVAETPTTEGWFNLSHFVSPLQPKRLATINDKTPSVFELLPGGNTNNRRIRMVYENAVQGATYEFIVNEELNWLPEKMRLTFTNLKPTVITDEVYKYEYRNGEWVWVGTETLMITDGKERGQAVSTVIAKYGVVGETPIPKECYLSYYNLPEPKFASTFRRDLFGILAIVSAVGILIAWRMLKPKRIR